MSFTDQQKADYVAGKAVKLENVTDKQGFHATMYIKFNPEKGRPYRYDTNPDNAQQVAPSNESRTQVAVNNDGKTNEATKESERAVAERSDQPEGRPPATAAGEAAEENGQGHENVIPCPPLNQNKIQSINKKEDMKTIIAEKALRGT